MFCFPNSDHVMLPRELAFFFHLLRIPMHRMYVHKTTFERNSPLGYQSRGLKWENKTYKLKRSIMWHMHCISKI